MHNKVLPYRFFMIASIIIIWLGFAIRLYNLGGDSLWMDEIFTATHSRGALVFSDLHHPPLFYALAGFSYQVFGENEFALRWPSFVASILSLPLLILLGTLLKSRNAGLWAAFLLMLLPFHLKYAQEARFYALLLTFSLATYIFLILAFKRQKFGYFLIYAFITALNIYTHYGAFLVLMTQTLLISGWLIQQILMKCYRSLLMGAISAFVVIVLYLPWISNFQIALTSNLEKGVEGTGDFAPLDIWFREIFREFGYRTNELSIIMLALFIMGLIIMLWKKNWFSLIFVFAGTTVALMLIHLFQVARWAFPKYVIYILPFYLVSAAISLDFITDLFQHRFFKENRTVYVGIVSIPVIGLFLLTVPLLVKEYNYMERDWRGVARYLSEEIQKGDVIIAFTLDLDDGFNQVSSSLPYYLDQYLTEYVLLSSNSLTPDGLLSLVDTDQKVWAVAFNRVVPMRFDEGSGLSAKQFAGSVYLVENSQQVGSTLDEIILMYENVTPLSVPPSPQCLLYQDFSALYATQNAYWPAYLWLERAIEQCPEEPNYGKRSELMESILSGFLTQIPIALENGDMRSAKEIATVILRYNDKEQNALAVLTYENLLNSFQKGLAEVKNEGSPEPTEVRNFLMPENGDEREVLFAHPPTTISFPIQLTQEPVVFQTKIGLDPQSRGWGGDGVTFVVSLTEATGKTTELFRKHLHNDETGYGWHDVQLPLANYVGQTITLALTTEVGDVGNASGDWAGWANPRIMWALSDKK